MAAFWVIDASVIGIANDTDHSLCADAIELLNRLHRGKFRIVVNNEIPEEYWRVCRGTPKGLGSKWWHRMQQSSSVERRFQSLSNNIRQELRNRNFHIDDDKFIAAALAVHRRCAVVPIVYIVQEDREDFSRVGSLLTSQGVGLATIKEAIQIIEDTAGLDNA